MLDADFFSIGIDPGKKGGICILYPGRVIHRLTPMPDTELGIWCWLNNTITQLKLHADGKDTKLKACIEKVGGYIGSNEERGGDRGSHMFVFGRTYGALVMALFALDIPLIEIAPRTWQSYYSLSREEGEGDTEYKNRLKDKAKELYPKDKITLNTCDAILISYYLSRR